MFGSSAPDQRLELHALRELSAAEKILVAIRHGAPCLSRAEYLDVGFHDWGILAKRLHFRLFLRHDLVHHLRQGDLLLASRRKWDRTQHQCQRHGQDLQGTHNASQTERHGFRLYMAGYPPIATLPSVQRVSLGSGVLTDWLRGRNGGPA